MSSAEFTWLETVEQIEEAVARWCNGPCVAIDTEFVRENTYYAKAGLIQLADHKGVYLIDPLAIGDLNALAPLLESDQCIKIMHSMSEDIELLYQACGAAPKPIFDTQVAAAFLGYGPSLGYQALVEKVLGIELDKGETRSDWCKRPLRESQLAYAAKDAEYLITLYDALVPKLVARQLDGAVLDECGFTVSQSVAGWEDDELAYLKLRGAWDLPDAKQRLLQSLVAWRDRTAKEQNIPKPWVFSDAQLIEAARYQPSSAHELKRLDRIKPKSIRLYGQALLELIEDFVPDDEPFVHIDRPIKGKELDVYKKLKKVVQKASEETEIVAQLLGSRKMLENIVIHRLRKQQDGLPDEYLGWRYPYVGDALIKALES